MADRGQQIRYYRPYDSSDESGSDAETASTDSWYSQGFDQHRAPPGQLEGHPNFRAFATQIQLVDAGGRGFSTIQDELAYSTDQLGRNVTYSAYEPGPPPETQEANVEGNNETTTTLILIDSRYRDRIAYPQPTDFSLRLPRIYKNVTNITLSDVKLLTSFYFFRISKGNTDITVYEKGRTTLTYENTIQSTIVKRFIQEGSYNIDQLQNEIQIQLNYVPLFRDYPNGYGDFVTAFRASGDYFLNFNYPGDYYFDNITNQWIPNPTIDIIVKQYWPSRFAGLTSYTANQILLAYYYPVVNEYLFDEEYLNQPLNLQVGIGINPEVTTVEDVSNYLKYDFLGINPPDPICLAVINANQSLLNKYRLEHTFRYWLINKYVVNRDVRSQNVYIASPSLNTSLINFITAQQVQYFNQALNIYGLTRQQYSNLVVQSSRGLAVLSAMYDYLQQRFLTYFAVPWSQYTLDYYAHLDWQIYTQNGLGAFGIASNDASALQQGIVGYTSNILTQLSTNPPYYWPNMSNLSQSTIAYVNLSSATSTFNLVYDMTSSNFLSNTIIDDTTGYFYSELLAKEGNAVCPIEPGKYTVFKFHSPVRQTMQVETLPRPSVYRIPAYNQANFNSTINAYYDLSYAYRFTPTNPYPPTKSGYEMAYDNLPSTNLNTVPGWENSNALSTNVAYSMGRTYTSSIANYTSSLFLDVISYNRALYTNFISPEYPGSNGCNYTYQMNVSVIFYSTFTNTTTLMMPTTPFRMFFYHDRGAFEGDVSGVRNENPKFYKFSTVINTTDTSGTIQFTAYPKQQYFISLRSDDFNFGSVFARVVPWFSTPIVSTVQTTSIAGINPQTDICGTNFPTLITTNFNYAQVYDSNFIRLPINSNLWPPDPANNSNNAYLNISNTPIGYDTNNVSSDYTDYVPYVINSCNFSYSPNCNFGIDPITKYNFQSNSPYNCTTQVFIDGGSNAIFEPGIGAVYTPATVSNRQYKIAHYYSLNYIPESTSNFPLTSNAISAFSNAQLPYTISTTHNTPIPGYSYATSACNIQLGYGVLGFNFIPDEGVWDVPRLMFRSAIQDSNNDPNVDIKYMAIFKMVDILHTTTSQLSISSARIVLSNSARVTYTSTPVLANAGFDVKGGTYYEFKKDSSYVAPNYSQLLGYTQSPSTMVDQPDSMYTAIAFSEYGRPLTIKALSGSAVPYPLYNDVFVSTAYIDGTQAYQTNYGVVFPSTISSTWSFVSTSTEYQYGPPSTLSGQATSITQSRTVLSQPIGTTVLNIKSTLGETVDSNFLWPWTTTLTPTLAIGTVPNFLLLQDTQITVYTYQDNDPSRILSTPTWLVSADQIYPSYEQTSLVGITGNSSDYYFLGFSNSNAANTHFSFRMKRFSPTTGVLSDYPLDTSFNVPIGGTLKSFTINDFEQIVVGYQEPTNTTKLYRNITPSTSMSVYVSLTAPSTVTHAMDPTTSTLYYLPLNGATNQGVGVYQAFTTAAGPGTLYTPTGTGTPATWTTIAVTAASNVPTPGNDYIYLASLTTGYESNVYYSSNWTSGPNTFQMQRISTSITQTSGGGQALTSLTNGYRGSLWLTAANQPAVWGTRNTEIDIDTPITTAWQIFYPFQKIVLEKLAQIYNPITDLTFLNYPEYPHTAMFYYNNTASYNADTKHKWGLESNANFIVGDGSMQGYYFNSYIFNVPLKASSNTDYQYLTVRGYSPTESSETLIRFVLPNTLDFGYETQIDLITEISTLNTTPTLYNSNYAFNLGLFDVAFQQSNSFFGQGLIPDFTGSNYNSSNFGQFASNFSTIYANYSITSQTLSNINVFVTSNIQYFLSTQFIYILPPEAQGRQNITDPIIFSLYWRTGLLPQYAQLLEDWGLGYNLGYAKRDTPFSTYHRAESFYKILDDYIYLRMNQEFSLNRMDTTSKENFNRTRDSTGSVQNFHGKLILNNFNTYSTTFIYNNRPLNPAIGKLETMYFAWVNFVGQIIDNADCDWTASLVITESKKVKDLSLQTIPGGFGNLIRQQEGGGPLRSQRTAAEVAQAGRAPTGGRGARAGAGLG